MPSTCSGPVVEASVETRAFNALMCVDPEEKCARVAGLRQDWDSGVLMRNGKSPVGRIGIPGRPARPELVDPDRVPRRNPHSARGHAALVHAVAHIEFNAINLALDCAMRFSVRGDAFVAQWLRVAAEEAHHFSLLAARLQTLGHTYGDFAAHNGLWEMAVKTDADFTARMALVPRLLEARGLDATPLIQARLREIDDAATLAILDIILRDEIGHVAVGDHWFRVSCAEQGLDAEDEYLRLIAHFEAPPPKPPFNVPARLAAGFSEAELQNFIQLRQI